MSFNKNISGYKNPELTYKADIVLKVRGAIKYVSIKKEIKNSVRVERLDAFIIFLKECNVHDKDINLLLYVVVDDFIWITKDEIVKIIKISVKNQ